MICPACGEECTIREEDQGVGYTDAWGKPDIDSHIVVISDCCEASIDYDVIRAYLEDRDYDGP